MELSWEQVREREKEREVKGKIDEEKVRAIRDVGQGSPSLPPLLLFIFHVLVSAELLRVHVLGSHSVSYKNSELMTAGNSKKKKRTKEKPLFDSTSLVVK